MEWLAIAIDLSFTRPVMMESFLFRNMWVVFEREVRRIGDDLMSC